ARRGDRDHHSRAVENRVRRAQLDMQSASRPTRLGFRPSLGHGARTPRRSGVLRRAAKTGKLAGALNGGGIRWASEAPLSYLGSRRLGGWVGFRHQDPDGQGRAEADGGEAEKGGYAAEMVGHKPRCRGAQRRAATDREPDDAEKGRITPGITRDIGDDQW